MLLSRSSRNGRKNYWTYLKRRTCCLNICENVYTFTYIVIFHVRIGEEGKEQQGKGSREVHIAIDKGEKDMFINIRQQLYISTNKNVCEQLLCTWTSDNDISHTGGNHGYANIYCIVISKFSFSKFSFRGEFC